MAIATISEGFRKVMKSQKAYDALIAKALTRKKPKVSLATAPKIRQPRRPK